MHLGLCGYQLISSGDQAWKLRSCKVDNLQELGQFCSNSVSLDELKEFSLNLVEAFQVHHALDKMIALNVKSLKRFELIYKIQDNLYNFGEEREPLQLSPFISEFTQTLQAVHLEGEFDTGTYKILFNELPHLKHLILIPYIREDQLAVMESLEAQPNHSIETFFFKLYNPRQTLGLSQCFTRLSSVKTLIVNQDAMSSVNCNLMLKLHTVHLMISTTWKTNCQDNIFPNVTTLCLSEACYSKHEWDDIAMYFTNVEHLIIKFFSNHELPDYDLDFDLDMIPRCWKTLKRIEFGLGFYATIGRCIEIFEDFRELKEVVVSSDAISWDPFTVMADIATVNEFTLNGLRCFSLCDVTKVQEMYEKPTLKSFMQSPSISSGVEFQL